MNILDLSGPGGNLVQQFGFIDLVNNDAVLLLNWTRPGLELREIHSLMYTLFCLQGVNDDVKRPQGVNDDMKNLHIVTLFLTPNDPIPIIIKVCC